MKRRVHKIVNFFAFNLLFFALYLNFVHKEKADAEPIPAASINPVSTSNEIVFKGTVPVSDPEKYLVSKSQPESAVQH
jgi:hypothetical protein